MTQREGEATVSGPSEAELFGQPNVTQRPVAFWHGASASNATLLLAGIVVSPGELADIRREAYAAGRAAALEEVAERVRAGIRPIVADWFDTGYENGKLDSDVLAERVLALLSTEEGS